MKNKLFISLLPLYTERLIIRPTSINDVDLMLKMDKQEVTQRFLGGVKNKTREERIQFLEKKENKFKDGYASQLTVCLKDGTPIGFTGLSIREDSNTAEISYLYDADYTGNGYATEACRKLLDVGFNVLKLQKIFGDIVDGNIASMRIMEKLNFKHEGTRKDEAFLSKENEYRDFLDYGLLASDYDNIHNVELLDVYDNNGKVTGRVIQRGDKSVKLNNGEHIGVAIIYIENADNKFLIQKTSDEKGGQYSSTGGHIDHLEDAYTTIIREVKEELGIDISKDNVIDLGFIEDRFLLRFTFYLKKNINLNDVVLQSEEVESVSYKSENEISELLDQGLMHEGHYKVLQKVLDYKKMNS